MKRIVLFLLTNLAVVAVMSVVLSLLGVNRFLTANGLQLSTLLAFSLVVGFTGAIFCLLGISLRDCSGLSLHCMSFTKSSSPRNKPDQGQALRLTFHLR